MDSTKQTTGTPGPWFLVAYDGSDFTAIATVPTIGDETIDFGRGKEADHMNDTNQTKPAKIAPGARVRLKPARNWLSQYAPLAKHGRTGTVTALEGDSRAHVEFDVVRRGAKSIIGWFRIADLIDSGSPKVEQMEAML